MKHVLAIALTLAAGAAQAQMPYPLPPAALPNKAALPPLEFDKPFTGKLKVIRGDKFLMDRLCPKTAFTPALGCSYSANDFSECVVIMAEDGIIYDAGWSPQIVWRHERGHCLGWPINHPNARPANQETMSER